MLGESENGLLLTVETMYMNFEIHPIKRKEDITISVVTIQGV